MIKRKPERKKSKIYKALTRSVLRPASKDLSVKRLTNKKTKGN